MNDQFDPATFLDATLEEPSLRRPPLIAQDYLAVIGEPKTRTFAGKKDPSRTFTALDIPLEISVPLDQREAQGRDTVTVTDSIFLDLVDGPNGPVLDRAAGKNTGVARYREALDMNKPGDKWSARRMQGRPIRVRIKHDVYEGNIQEKVQTVARP